MKPLTPQQIQSRKASKAKYYVANKEKIAAYHRNYLKRNAESKNAKNREKRARLKVENPEMLKATEAEKYKRNRETSLACSARWAKTNVERNREKARRWWQKNHPPKAKTEIIPGERWAMTPD